MTESTYLLDVNVYIALLSEDHVHHELVTSWFSTPHLKWAICAFTEAGFLRFVTAPRSRKLAMDEASAVLTHMAGKPGYRYLSIDTDWQALHRPFAKRVYGTKQVTDAYLLGLAVWNGCVLATMDRGVVHLAGAEYAKHVLLLE